MSVAGCVTLQYVTLVLLLAVPQTPDDQDARVDQLATKVLATDDTNDKVDAWYRLYKAIESDRSRQLGRVMRHANNTIAVQTSWLKYGDLTLKQALNYKTPKRVGRAQFIGFLEGRVRIVAPEWWAKLVIDDGTEWRKAHTENYAGFRYLYSELGEDLIAIPKGVSVRRIGKGFALKQGENLMKLPGTVFTDRERNDDGSIECGLSVAFTASHCFLAVHGSFGSSHPLYCIERRSGDIVWKANVTGSFLWGGSSGVPHTWVSVSVQRNQVCLFGVTNSGGAFVHTCDPKTGKKLFEFSTAYTGHYANHLADEED